MEKEMVPRLTVAQVRYKQVWVNSGSQIEALNTSRLIFTILNENRRYAVTLLNSLRNFSTCRSLGVLLSKTSDQEDYRIWTTNFKKQREIKT